MKLPTSIATSDEESITIRGNDLTRDLVGNIDFGEFFYFHLCGEKPNESEARLFNAMLVTIAEHGITPSVIATRLMYDSAPEAMQGAVSAGLLGTGEKFVGSMQNVTEMVEEGVDRLEGGETVENIAESVVEERDRLPGFGHPEHHPTDPRTDRLFELLEEENMAGDHLKLIQAIQNTAENEYGTHLLINATGAIGVVLAEMDIKADAMAARGIALVARAAGLVGHINEEIEEPIARDIWDLVLDNVEYKPKQEK